MANQQVKQEHFQQAVAPLLKYTRRELKYFLKSNQLEFDGEKEKLIERIQTGISRGKISLESLDNFIGSGRQVIFLGRLKDPSKSEIFTSKNKIRNRLTDLIPDLKLGKVKETWESQNDPVLCSIAFGDAERLIFKWVETREWKQLNPDAVDLSHSSRLERSINFFVWDNVSKTVQVRLQEFQTFPNRKPQEELEIYYRLVSEFFEEDYRNLFLPQSIEPAIRHLLTSKTTKINSWRITSPTVGGLSGKADPAIFISFIMPFGDFFGEKIDCTWSFSPNNVSSKKREVTTFLDSQSNSVKIGECVSEELKDKVLNRLIKLQPKYDIRLKELRILAQEEPIMESVLLTLDVFLSRNIAIVKSKQLINWWNNIEKVREVFRMLAKRFPGKFKLEGASGDILMFKSENTKGAGLLGMFDKILEKMTVKKPTGYLRVLESVGLFLVLYTLFAEPVKLLSPIINRIIADPLAGDIVNVFLHLIIAGFSIWLLIGGSRIVKMWRFFFNFWETLRSLISRLGSHD